MKRVLIRNARISTAEMDRAINNFEVDLELFVSGGREETIEFLLYNPDEAWCFAKMMQMQDATKLKELEGKTFRAIVLDEGALKETWVAIGNIVDDREFYPLTDEGFMLKEYSLEEILSILNEEIANE